jgi:hypothetical protein
MAIFHLFIRPISRAKGHSAVAQIAYDTRCKLTNGRTGEKHDWSKHERDVIKWQVIGPKMAPDELSTRAEQAEKRWDARVGRAMDVALPNQLSMKAQWEVLRRVRPSTARYLRSRALRESAPPEFQGR